VGGAGESSRPDRSFTHTQRPGRPDSSAVPVSAGSQLQGIGKHGRYGQLRLQGSL